MLVSLPPAEQNRIYSIIKPKVEAADTATTELHQAQRTNHGEFQYGLQLEIIAMRKAMSPNESASVSDNDLTPKAIAQLHQKQIDNSRAKLAAAQQALADARTELATARREATRLRLPPLLTETEDRLFPEFSTRPIVSAMREVVRRLDRQEATRRVEKIQSVEKLLEMVRRSEDAEDVITAIVAEEALEERLAAGPTEAEASTATALARSKGRYGTVAADLKAHRDRRIDPQVREVLASYESQLETAAKQFGSANLLQQAINSRGHLLVEEPAVA
jgi:hypothetical protein